MERLRKPSILRLALTIGTNALLLFAMGSILRSSLPMNQASGRAAGQPGAPLDAHDTTGPLPPADVDVVGVRPTAADVTVTVPGVPAYNWTHGCGPTSGAMVLGYWDTLGYDLIPGEGSAWKPEIREVIASTGPASHYTDYSLPDDGPGNILPDKSELPEGDEHADNCVADFMLTSQSYYDNPYAQTWNTDLGPGMEAYTRYRLGIGAQYVDSERLNMNWSPYLTWEKLQTEIDAGRPMVFLVDTNGNGGVDHYVPVVGYGIINDTQHYACFNTWDFDIHWWEFAPVANGQPWGVHSGVTFQITTPDQEASFTAAPTFGFAPLNVQFTNTSSGDFNSSLWDFGDGDTDTATHPTHIYETPGAYTVTLTMSGPGGTDTHTRANYVTAYEPVQAGFDASPRSGDPPHLVQFTDGSSGPVATWEWRFGDGGTSPLPNPTHTYATTGVYTVSLTVRAAGGSASWPGGSDILTIENYIIVGGHPVYLPMAFRGP